MKKLIFLCSIILLEQNGFAAGEFSGGFGSNYNVLYFDGEVAGGNVNSANGNGAIALGNQNIATKAGTNNTTAQTNGADGVVAIGNMNIASGQGSVAIGNKSVAGTSAKAGSIAIGDQAIATANAGDIALGSGSITSSVVNTSSVAINGILYGSFAGTSATSTLSVGKSGQERTITNVAAGRISASSTDAINGSQLYSVADKLSRGFTLDTGAFGGSTSGGSPTQIKPGDTMMIGAGHNMDVGQSGGVVVLSSANDVDFNSVTVGSVVIDSSTGINAGGTVIFNVADGVNPTDAINVQQLETAIDTVNNTLSSKTFGIKDQDGLSIIKPLDDTIDIVGSGSTVGNYSSDNVKTKVVGGQLQIQMSDSPKFGNVVINDSNSGKITGLTAGSITATSTDAVNGSQLYTVQNQITTINNNVIAAKTEVVKGTNVTDVSSNTAPDGHTIYTVNANGTSVSAGSSAVTIVAGTKDANNVVNYSVDLSQSAKDSLTKADSSLQTVVTQINGMAVKVIDKSHNTANFVDGTNIKLADDGNGGIKISTLDDVIFNKVTVGSVIMDSTGINAGNTKIMNLSDGLVNATSKDAVNGS